MSKKKNPQYEKDVENAAYRMGKMLKGMCLMIHNRHWKNPENDILNKITENILKEQIDSLVDESLEHEVLDKIHFYSDIINIRTYKGEFKKEKLDSKDKIEMVRKLARLDYWSVRDSDVEAEEAEWWDLEGHIEQARHIVVKLGEETG